MTTRKDPAESPTSPIDLQKTIRELRAEEREMERAEKIAADPRGLVSNGQAGKYLFIRTPAAAFGSFVKRTEFSRGVPKISPEAWLHPGESVVAFGDGDVLPSDRVFRRLIDEEAATATSADDGARMTEAEAPVLNANGLLSKAQTDRALAERLVEQKRAELAQAEQHAEEAAGWVESASANAEREKQLFDGWVAEHGGGEGLARLRAAVELMRRPPPASEPRSTEIPPEEVGGYALSGSVPTALRVQRSR